MNIFKKIVSFFNKKDKPPPYKVDLTKVKMSQIDMSVEERIRSRWAKEQWPLMRLGAYECIKKGLPMNSHEIQQQAGLLWKKKNLKD